MKSASLLARSLLVLLIALVATGSVNTRSSPDLVVVLTMDTTRQDLLGAYGNTHRLTPNLDALAARGVLFENAYAPSDHTRPSVTSLMTGLYPAHHGMWMQDSEPSRSTPNLAGVFKAHGYRTIWINANPNTTGVFGRDFDALWSEYPGKDTPWWGDYYGSDYVFDRAWDALKTAGFPSKVFLYVQVADPHPPYTPREYYPDIFAGDPIGRNYRPEYATLRVDQALLRATPADITNARNRYQAEVRWMDQQIGRFLSGLTERYKSNLIVAVADHGEAFLDHGDVAHTTSLYDSEIRVPFIVADSTGRLSAGRRASRLASLVDVLPTLADYLDGQVPRDIDGISLMKDMERSWKPRMFDSPPSRIVISEVIYPLHVALDAGAPELEAFGHPFTREQDPYMRAVMLQPPAGWLSAAPIWKTIDSRADTDVLKSLRVFQGHYHELYQITDDPGERRNLYSSRSQLASTMNDWAGPIGTLGAAVPQHLTQEQIDRLRALGYVGKGRGGS